MFETRLQLPDRHRDKLVDHGEFELAKDDSKCSWMSLDAAMLNTAIWHMDGRTLVWFREERKTALVVAQQPSLP